MVLIWFCIPCINIFCAYGNKILKKVAPQKKGRHINITYKQKTTMWLLKYAAWVSNHIFENMLRWKNEPKVADKCHIYSKLVLQTGIMMSEWLCLSLCSGNIKYSNIPLQVLWYSKRSMTRVGQNEMTLKFTINHGVIQSSYLISSTNKHNNFVWNTFLVRPQPLHMLRFLKLGWLITFIWYLQI